jgi:hypothetical protein
MANYYDQDLRLALHVPPNWDIASTDEFTLILLAPEVDGFRANMSFLVNPFDPATPEHLEQVIAETRQDRLATYQDFDLRYEDRLLVNDAPTHVEYYHWRMDETDLPLGQMFALLVTFQRELYSLHATTLREHETLYEPIFREILLSLQFGEPN